MSGSPSDRRCSVRQGRGNERLKDVTDRAGNLAQAAGGGLVQPISAGILTALVGFASTFAVVLEGLRRVGADRTEAASGLLVVLLAMGVVAISLSLRWRMPVSIAWSTPGAALLIATGAPAGGYPAAVGAFLAAALLIVVAGLVRSFGRAVSAIPASLASAMLAGLLLELCFAPVKAVDAMPLLAAPIVASWALAWRFARSFAVPIAVLVTVLIVVFATPLPADALADIRPKLTLVWPSFSLGAMVSLALPLFVVTMASQNIPGLAVLRVNGYDPAVGSVFFATGLASVIIAPFGGLSVNLAAITAALSAGPDAHPDPGRRWIASTTAGFGYVVLGLTATFATAFVAASPPLLVEAVAGLALLGSLAGSLQAALLREDERVPAVLTFVVAASGVSFAGIGSAFWALLAGGALMALGKLGAKRP